MIKIDKENFPILLRKAVKDIEIEKESREETSDKYKETCPSEEVFSYYFGLPLSSFDKERIEGHIASCAHCRHTLIAITRMENEMKNICQSVSTKKYENQPPFPLGEVCGEGALSNNLFKIKDKIEISLAWVKNHLILKNTNIESFHYWNAVSSALMPIRDSAQSEEGDIPPFIQTFPKCKVMIKIRKESNEKSTLYCRVFSIFEKTETGSPLIIDLILGGHRFRSSCQKNQGVLFERIGPGNYTLIVREKDIQLAEIFLTISPDISELIG